MNTAGSQDTGFFGSCFPSVSSLQSDIQDRLSLRSQKEAHTALDKGPGQPQGPLPSTANPVVSITNNNFYMGPKPLQTVRPGLLSFPPQPIEARMMNTHTHSLTYTQAYTYTHALTSNTKHCIFSSYVHTT